MLITWQHLLVVQTHHREALHEACSSKKTTLGIMAARVVSPILSLTNVVAEHILEGRSCHVQVELSKVVQDCALDKPVFHELLRSKKI
jgi:hypothetical protein